MDRKYKNFTEIRQTFGERNHNNFDYYDAENVAVIHFKFGNAYKAYTGLVPENNLPEEFITEYKKYFDGKGDEIKGAADLVFYVAENNLPVIFYANFSDKEMNLEETLLWLMYNTVLEAKDFQKMEKILKVRT